MTTPTGQPPTNEPYGQPPAGYGTPPPGQAPYGQQPGAGVPPPFGQPGAPELAGFGARFQSAFVDWLGPSLIASLVQITINVTLGQLLAVAALGWALYNAYLQGSTGQSVGKKRVGLRLLREGDGQVLGGGLGIGRYFLHIVDALPLYLGFLWPLWDSKKQTFADKIVKSVVIKA